MKILKETRGQQSLVEKWSNAPKALSIKSIKDPYIRANTAKLLENQLHPCMNEDFSTGVTGSTGLNQGIPNGGDGKGVFAPISMALQRRVFPQLLANQLVGVQPLNGPVGLAFALRRIYKTNDPSKVIEAAWKHIPDFSGFTGNFAGSDGERDAGTAVETEASEQWKIGGDADKFERMPELTLMMSRQSIVAKTRKLAASFSLEAAEDIKRMQGVDMMSEIVKTLQYEVTAEIDRETIAHCKALCQPITYKRATPTGDNIADDDTGLVGWNGTWSQQRISNIILKIKAAANSIATATRMNAANIAIVSPDIATALESAAPFFNKVEAKIGAPTSTPEIGTLNGSIKVFRDVNTVDAKTGLDDGSVLLAYKGEGINDCGVVYCPYVTGVQQQAIDPRDFSPRVGVMTRYAFADNLLGAENYYRYLRFEGLNDALGGQTW